MKTRIGVTLLGTEGNVICVMGPSQGANVLLVLKNRFGVLIPAPRDFIAGLTFEDGIVTARGFALEQTRTGGVPA
jgi:hypothetical protein